MAVDVKNILLSWSSGKDSAWALHLLSRRLDLRVAALVTTFNGATGRVAMHGVRRSLVEQQAEKAGLPLWAVDLPWPCSNSHFEDRMRPVWQRAKAEEITGVAFGDLFLEDIRAYRERQLEGSGLEPMFPLWQMPTAALALDMIAAGVRAKITCIDGSKLDVSFAGREYDAAFLRDLPPQVDPCGEAGEFHSFVYDSPVFDSAFEVEAGEIVERDGFIFADVLVPSPLSRREAGSGVRTNCP